METAVSRLNEFNLTSVEIGDFVEQVTREVCDGNYDVLEVAKNIKVMEEIAKGLKERLQYDINEEANKHGKSFAYHGCEFEIKIRNTPDFKSCNDTKLNEALTMKKEREAFLKVLKSEVADPETGEIIKPPVFRSTEYIQIKLK